jgi:hypothetical protein
MSKRDFFSEIAKEEKPLLDEIRNARGQSDKMIEVLNKRYRIYDRYERIMEGLERYFVNSMKTSLLTQIMIYKTKKDFDEQIAEIITRIDVLEEDFKTLKNQKA